MKEKTGQPANNFPLKGRKCSSWDGGTRVAAMVTGGFIPSNLRGTTSEVLMHVADWYVTLSTMVGVDPSDPVEIGGAVHDVDGVDMWPAIIGANRTNPRRDFTRNQEHLQAHFSFLRLIACDSSLAAHHRGLARTSGTGWVDNEVPGQPNADQLLHTERCDFGSPFEVYLRSI